jgi:hypothetical protein
VRREVEPALEWLTPGFVWATSGWAAEQPWPEAKAAFHAAVGIDGADSARPGYRLVRRFVEYVDTQVPDTERRAFLADSAARADVVAMFAAADYQPAAASSERRVL